MKLHQLKAAVAVRGPHHCVVVTDTVEPDDAVHPGDEAAAGLDAELTRLVQGEVGRRDGKAVKWLGDGVMFSFRDAAAAVLATIEVGRRTGEVGLPPAHAGIAMGPVIFQDGDYYGRTVNLAARLLGSRIQARPWSMPRSSDSPGHATTSVSEVSATSH